MTSKLSHYDKFDISKVSDEKWIKTSKNKNTNNELRHHYNITIKCYLLLSVLSLSSSEDSLKELLSSSSSLSLSLQSPSLSSPTPGPVVVFLPTWMDVGMSSSLCSEWSTSSKIKRTVLQPSTLTLISGIYLTLHILQCSILLELVPKHKCLHQATLISSNSNLINFFGSEAIFKARHSNCYQMHWTAC